jgi:hypothetical protein
MRFYLTHSASVDNIIKILSSGEIKPSGGDGITNTKGKSKYLYFELVSSKLKRHAPGTAIYFNYNILKDYDFYYTNSWCYVNNDTKMGYKFPKTNIYNKLKTLENKYINKIKKPIYGYQFVTKNSILLHKYMKFVSNPTIYPHKINTLFTKEEKIINKILKSKYPKTTILNNYNK